MGELSSSIDVERLLAERGWVHGLAQRLLGEAEGAEDVAQDAWVAALESRSAKRGAGGFPAWVAAVARNLALRRRRQSALRRHHERNAARTEAVASAGDELERVELQRRLAAELLALEEPLRTAVVLRHFEGLRHRAIAERLGISEAAVRQRVSRGLATLRARLSRSFEHEGRSWIKALLVVCPQGDAALRTGLMTGGVLMATKGIVGGVGALVLGVVAFVLWPSRGVSSAALAPAQAAASVVDLDGPAPPGSSSRVVSPGPVASPADRRSTSVLETAPTQAGVDLRVVDRGGHPLESAWVVRADDPDDRKRTDSNGHVSLGLGETESAPGLGAAPLRFVISHDGHIAHTLTLESLEPLEVVLLALPQVRGELLGADGNPISARSRVRIGVWNEAAGALETRQVELDQGGSFHFPALPRGRLRWVEAEAMGFFALRQEREVTLVAETVEQLTLTLIPGVVVEGIVLDESDGRPLPGAFVWTRDFFWDEGDLHPSTSADGQGRFRLDGVELWRGSQAPAAPAVLRLFARAEGYSGDSEATVLPWREDGHYTVELRLARSGASLAGVLRAPGGALPAPSVRLLAIDATRKIHNGTTDDEGRFRFDDMPPGATELFAWQGPLQRGGTLRSSMELEPGEQREQDFELVASRDSRIAGRVIDGRGAALEEVTIDVQLLFRLGGLTAGPLDWFSVATDEAGRFEVDGLPPGNYVLRCKPGDALAGRPESLEVELALDGRSEGWEFLLGQPATFAGTLASDSRRISRLRLVLAAADDDEELQRIAPDAMGRFLFQPVPEGPYVIHVLAAAGERLETLALGPIGADNLNLFVP